MIEVSVWMDTFLQALQTAFGDRVWFVGLQGSYSRGEATAASDIDTVVILDTLSAADIRAYAAMLEPLPHRELVCGFLAGRAELENWDAADLFQFYHDTVPVRGSLDSLLPRIDTAAVDRAIRLGACNLYHGCVHNMLYDKSEELLVGLYKAASFTVQAIAFRQTGRYIRRQSELREAVQPQERAIVDTFLYLKNGGAVEFGTMSDTLFDWCRGWIGTAD